MSIKDVSGINARWTSTSAGLAAGIFRPGGSSGQRTYEWTYERSVVVLIAALIILRIVCAANIPLAFDEALYWRYSKHLAFGYLDHPFMNPLMIRIGTTLLGDTPLGVRFVAVLLAVPASWAVWRSGAALFGSERIGAMAALFFNVTIVMMLGSLLATSDEVVVTAAALLLFGLSKVEQTGRGAWWLAVGAAFGFGMCSKYTMLFFAVSILAWLLVVPERRKWLASPWTWAGGGVAVLCFLPVLIWNADHHWASFVYQSKRLVVHEWTLRFLGELVASQFGLATPSIFVLSCIALFSTPRQDHAQYSSRVMLAAMVWPILAYFAWHALHQRVQGNWPEPIYPALAIACAATVDRLRGRASTLATITRWAARSAAPVGIGLAGIVYLQAIYTPFALGPSDPTARVLGVGWPAIAERIDALRAQTGAASIVTTEYESAAWLTFYLPSKAPVVQLTQRVRWSNEPAPDQHLFDAPALYVCRAPCGRLNGTLDKYNDFALVDVATRMRRGVAIEQYLVYRVAKPTRPVLDPLYADLQGIPAR